MEMSSANSVENKGVVGHSKSQERNNGRNASQRNSLCFPVIPLRPGSDRLKCANIMTCYNLFNTILNTFSLNLN